MYKSLWPSGSMIIFKNNFQQSCMLTIAMLVYHVKEILVVFFIFSLNRTIELLTAIKVTYSIYSFLSLLFNLFFPAFILKPPSFMLQEVIVVYSCLMRSLLIIVAQTMLLKFNEKKWLSGCGIKINSDNLMHSWMFKAGEFNIKIFAYDKN